MKLPHTSPLNRSVPTLLHVCDAAASSTPAAGTAAPSLFGAGAAASTPAKPLFGAAPTTGTSLFGMPYARRVAVCAVIQAEAGLCSLLVAARSALDSKAQATAVK
jgi:hypothetical protein